MSFIRRLPIVLVLCALLPVTARAQEVSTWTGGGSDDNWSTTGNWAGAGVPSDDTGDNVVVFSGTSRPNTVNNLGDWSRSFGQMYFASGAASFALSGNTFGFRAYLGSGTQQIFQNSANTQTIGVSAFSFRNDADSRINLNAGDLVITTPNMFIDSASSVRSLIVAGTDSTRRTVTFAGNVNKGGGDSDPDMYIQANKRALVTGSLTFGSGNDGSVFVDDGVLQFSGAGTMTGGRPVIGSTGGSGNAAVWLDTAGATFARQLELRNGSSGRRTIGGLNTSGTVTFSGDFAGGTDNFDLAAAAGGAAVFSGVRNFTSTLHVNRPDGATTYAGTVILSGTTNSTGGVGVYGGTLQFSDFNQLGTGYFGFEQDTGDSGTLRYTGGSTSVTKQLFSNKAGQTRAAIDVSQAGTTLNWTQSGGEFNRNLTKVGAGTLAFNGPITGAGGNVAVEAGMLILTGSNSYSGGTVVSGGTLEVSANGSQGGSPAALGTGTVSIASGGQVKYWLSLSGSNTVANPFSLSGGMLHTTDGFNTYSGQITLASGSSTISAQYEDTITLSGGLAGNGNVFFTQSGGTGAWAAPIYVLSGTGANTGTVRVSGSSGGGATKLQIANVNALQSATLDMAAGDTGAVEFTVVGNNTYNVGGLIGSRNLAYGSNALSIGGNNQSTTYSGGLSGSGLFTKVGSGTLTLAGVNSNSGGTTVSAGRLVGTTSSLQGAITNNAAVTFDQATSGTYSGAMTGSGSLTKIGDGVVALSGNNSFSGGVTLGAGVLALGSANALGSTGTISFNGGTLQYSASNTTDYSGRFSTAASQQYRVDTNGQSVTLGSDLTSVGGTLTKIGSGTLTLTGTNSYDGGTTVSGGRLVATTSQSLLTDVVNNAELEFVTNGGNYSFSGTISGTGSLIKSGSEQLNLEGANTYSGGTIVAAGTLVGSAASLQGPIVNRGIVAFGFDGDGTYAGVISGSGSLEVRGGNLIVTGTSVYTGATTISGGSRLAVNGALGSTAVTVQGGGELGGSGAVGGSVLVDGAGILSPGNSIASLSVGTTTFSGTAEFVPASTFEYEVDSTNLGALGTAADLLVVNGGLNLDLNDETILTFTDLASTPQAFVDDTTIFALINYAGAWNGGLFTYNGSVLADGDRFTVGSQEWEIDYNRTSSAGLDNFTGDYLPSSSFVAVTAVPEPSTVALALAGLAGGGWMMRRRKPAGGPRLSSLS